MNNQEILEKAIQKAIDGGWEQDLVWIHGNTKDKSGVVSKFLGSTELVGMHLHYNYDDFICIAELIFNHDFAKALWGEGDSNYYQHTMLNMVSIHEDSIPDWQYRLQQMVVAEDPIAYLGEHLNGLGDNI